MSDTKKSQKSKKKISSREDSGGIFVQRLEDICRSLAYISETDAAIEPFIVATSTARPFGGYTGALGIEKGPVEEVGFDEFFERLTATREWHRDVDRQRAMRFEKLRDLLRENLEDIRVIRVGKIRIDIYVVGVYDDTQLIGVRTKAIET
ncbi:MAG TPA: nuclease A inhibitor family protein [Pyrinomonadaceae bacterium]